MATSGSVNFDLTRNQILQEALELVNAVEVGQTPTGEQTVSASRTLNQMVKFWQARGINLWTAEWLTATLTASSAVLGTDGVDYECIRNHTSAADNKPVTGADYTTYWKELSTTAGGAWVTATAYTSLNNIVFPTDTLDVTEAFVRSSEQDYPMDIISRTNYFDIFNKSNAGAAGGSNRPDRIWVDMQEIPVGYMYPYPNSTSDVVHYTQIRKLEDFDAALNNPDLTQKFLEALTTGLASRLSPKYSLPIEERNDLAGRAEAAFVLAKLDDFPKGDLQFGIFRR